MVWVAVRFCVSVWVDGDGTTHSGAQVSEVVAQAPEPVQALHADQAAQTGAPAGSGQVAVRVWVRSSGRDWVLVPK